jgi:lipoprotein-releasing system permease protein
MEAMRNEIENLFPEVYFSTWRERHGARLRAVAHERKLIVIVLSMIVIVASFGILSIQWSFVKEKTRDIGILRAMGFSNGNIFSVFIGVSWLVGLTGLVFGLGGGALISLYANEIISFTGWRPFPGDLYYHEKLPVSLEWGDVLWISILSLSVTTCAGLFPAWKATTVEPVEAIAHE